MFYYSDNMSNSSALEDELALVSVTESNSATYDILLKVEKKHLVTEIFS